MTKFDTLIVGGGAAGISCALVLGSAKQRSFAADKNIGIVIHQRASSLQNAIFNNVLGLKPGTTGAELLIEGKKQLTDQYPHVTQIENEKVLSVDGTKGNFNILTNKNMYQAKEIVIAVGPKVFNIKGLEKYVALHPNLPVEKQRKKLKNINHIVDEGIYVAGTLAGLRSQFAIAAGSGAQVATDILTSWNDGVSTMIHDKITP